MSTLETTRYWMFLEEKIKKATMSSLGTDTTELTRNGRFCILMKRMQNPLKVLMKTVDSTETDHST